MPTKSKQHRSGGKKLGASQNAVIRLTGRYFRTVNVAALYDAFYVSPLLLDARLVSLSDGYQEYRFVRMKLSSWAQSQYTQGLSYSPGLLTTPPTTLAELENLENTAYGAGLFGAPFPKLNLTQTALLGPANVKWFRRGTAFDDTIEIQGLVTLASSVAFNTSTAYVLVEYEIELRASADTALTAAKPIVSNDDPIQDLESKVGDIQRALGIAARVVNPAKQRPRPQMPAVKQLPAAQPAQSEYVLVPRSQLTQQQAPPGS